MIVFSGQIYWSNFYLNLIKYIIIFSVVIPISIKCNVDVAKFFFCRFINKDSSIPGVESRNQNIPEELGRVEYFLTDKTGTLT